MTLVANRAPDPRDPQRDKEFSPLKEWTLVPTLTPELFAILWKSYLPAKPDDWDWVTFANWIRSGQLFVHSSGWFLVTGIRPGLSATIHGAKWSFRMNPDAPSVPLLLSAIMKEWSLRSLIAPCVNQWAAKRAESWGFKLTGLLKNQDMVAGKPVHVYIYTLDSA